MAEMKVRAAELLGKTIISEETGKKLGIVGNVEFVTESGELLNITIDSPSKYINEINLKPDEKGRIVLPFAAVKSIGDFVVISESELV